jgi:hypothetical protein
MNAALQLAQQNYDRALPPEDDDTAETEWIENGVEQLLLGADVRWKRRFEGAKSVTADDFRDRVQCHLVDRQKEGEDQCDAFADLVLSAMRGVADKASASYLLGTAQALRDLAVELLSPHAADGVEALLEEAEDDAL